MDYYSEVDFSMPDKLEAYYDDPEVEMSQMPELEEMENLENESHEDSPRPNKRNLRRSARSRKKKRKRSSSVESFEEGEEEADKIAPMSNTNKEINVGAEYQAVVPDDLTEDYPEDHEDQDERVWKRPESLEETVLYDYVDEANYRYRIPIDRALYILAKEGYNTKNAINFISSRNDLRDVWSDDEKDLFFNSFFIFGKNFRRVRTAMPHRSLTSIVQYYYDSKKRITYKKFSDNKADESIPESPDTSSETIKREKGSRLMPEHVFEDMCENCGERCEQMQIVEKANSKTQSECRACRIYYEIMDVPRPTSLRIVISERLKSHYNIPDYMKEFMRDYEVLTHPATGITYKNRFMGEDQSLEDIVGLSYMKNVKKEIKDEVEDVEMVEEKDEEPSTVLPEDFTITPDEPLEKEQLPQIWKQKHTICMEEIEVLADDSRKRMFEACVAYSNVNKKKLSSWKAELNGIRNRMERMQRDIDLAPSYMEAKRIREPPSETHWNERDTTNVLKLFKWYGKRFGHIADVLGTKNARQVAKFYQENKDYVENAIAQYELAMQEKMDKLEIKVDDPI